MCLEDPPESFIVVPTTLDPGVEYDFTVKVFSDTEAIIESVRNSAHAWTLLISFVADFCRN